MGCRHCHHKHGAGKECNGHVRFRYKEELLSLGILLLSAALARFGIADGALLVAFYVVALMPVGLPVLRGAWRLWRKGDFFNEFSLMVLACAGAFAIAEYPEGVAILLFYSFGEKLEDSATEKSRRRIMAMLDKLPETVTVEGRGIMKPEDVAVGGILVVKPGERVELDGRLLGGTPCNFDTSAFTGESLPVDFAPGAEVPAGAIPLDREVRIEVIKVYAESSMNRIMAMVESAASKKSSSETLLRRITRWYTPAVMVAAVLLFAVPWIVASVQGTVFQWSLWLERALVLLVCSCPCALVVSVPLGYFAAIGAASARGIVFKSSMGLDAMRSCDTLFVDKTGTVTTGSFRVSGLFAAAGFDRTAVLALAAAVDAGSSHPLAVAVCREADGIMLPEVSDVRTVPHGMIAMTDGGREVLVGSRKLLASRGISIPDDAGFGTEVCVAVGGHFAGAIYLADMLKDGVAGTLSALKALGIRNVEILSGDRPEVVASVAAAVGADSGRGGLLPGDKQRIVEEAVSHGRSVMFVGDGINDAPSLAAATVGIAIGAGGSDLAVEGAEAVITSTTLAPLAAAMRISRRTKTVVVQNVSLAIGVKMLVMILGAAGLATLWAAVFADTGITLLTVLWTIFAWRQKND